jgi:site-specific recombinase XerD
MSIAVAVTLSLAPNSTTMYDLQQHLGHSSLSTTEIYTDFLTPEEEQKAKRVGTKPGTDTTV